MFTNGSSHPLLMGAIVTRINTCCAHVYLIKNTADLSFIPVDIMMALKYDHLTKKRKVKLQMHYVELQR